MDLKEDIPPTEKEINVRVTSEFLDAFEGRKLGSKHPKPKLTHLQAAAEDYLVRKDYTEMKCEMPSLSRSTFLMVFSRDGTMVASTHGNHNIYVTDLRTGKIIRTLVGHPRTPWCIAFHPTSNQIIASGCLGGQVRIWDLSGGSEVWTTGIQNVIASLAFHPNDRVLVIATFNEIYFWDWSKPEPFVHTATNNPREKVRYVAFDKLGQRLITGISNSPLTRWERARAPVLVPRQPEQSASPYRRRITPRLRPGLASPGTIGEAYSDIAERERRITASYRNLVQEYEVLVHRYLQVYCPPTMVDRGTDPMESDRSAPSGSQVQGRSAISSTSTQQPSTSRQSGLIVPSELYSVRSRPVTLRRSTQTGEVPQQRSPRCLVVTKKEEVKEGKKVEEESRGKIRIKCCVKGKTADTPEEPQPGPSGLSSRSSNESGKNRKGNSHWWQLVGKSSDSSASSSEDEEKKPEGEPPKEPPKIKIKCSKKIQKNKSKSDRQTKLKKNLETTLSTTNDPAPQDTNQPEASSSNNSRMKLLRKLGWLQFKILSRTFRNNQAPEPQAAPEESSSQRSRNKRQRGDRLLKVKWRRLLVSSSDSSSSAEESNRENTSKRPCPEESREQPSTSQSTSTPTAPSSSVMDNYNTVLEQLVTNLLADNFAGTNNSSESGEDASNNNATNEPAAAVAAAAAAPGSDAVGERIFQDASERSTFGQDEVINYSERAGFGEATEREIDLSLLANMDASSFQRSSSPENLGVGNMYQNIVHDLESSVIDIYNIRSTNRPGETTDVLSGFAIRLENVITRSDIILQNLRQSLDALHMREPEHNESNGEYEFYLRVRNGEDLVSLESSPSRIIQFRGQSNISAEHSYPRLGSPRLHSQSDLVSLHLAVSHIQRQARLLRQQVECIEQIERAMLEVSQLNVMRHLFLDMSELANQLQGSESVSSVRQMMAGTRISDTNPQPETPPEPPSEPIDVPPETPEPVAGSSSEQANRTRPTRNRNNRKTYPPSRFFRMQRRRAHLANFFCKRYLPRDSRGNRRIPLPRPSWSPSNFRAYDIPLYRATNRTSLDSDVLSQMMRRLEYVLMDLLRSSRPAQQQHQQSGRPASPPLLYEPVIRLTLMGSRLRVNRLMNRSMDYANDQILSVTQDGQARSEARHALSLLTHSLSRYFEDHLTTRVSPVFQQQLRNVLNMGLLLTEILHLRLVDSVPAPAGVHLDPERETLTAEIDRICIQILNSGGQNRYLVRGVRLMRQTVLAASRILVEKYNALCPNDPRRRELVEGICRFIRDTMGTYSTALAPEWNAQLMNFVNRVNERFSPETTAASDNNSSLNAETGEFVGQFVAQTTSDDNEDTDGGGASTSTNNNNHLPSSRYQTRSTALYRTNHVNLLSISSANATGESSTGSLFRPWNVPSVQVNDVPVVEPQPTHSSFSPRLWARYSFRDRERGASSSVTSSLFRPRFLHPLYAGPFDVDMEQRDQMYDADMVTTVTPNHRIQVWDFSNGTIPSINNPLKNVVVKECKIHNDASVDIAQDGSILVTLLPSGGYLNVTNKLGVYSLQWETLGQCLYVTNFEQNAVSVSLSPLGRHLVVGLASRRVSIMPTEQFTMARIFHLGEKEIRPLRQLEQRRDNIINNYKSVNCIRWLPFSGQGLIYATNTGQLIVLT